MRLMPILILITFAVVSIKILSIVFDQNPIVSGITAVVAAEGDTSETAEGKPLKEGEISEADQKIAAEEAKKNEQLENDRKAKESAQNRKNIDLLIQNKQADGTTQFFTDTEIQLLQSLKQRRDLLDRRERKIDIQARLLQAAELQLDAKIAKLASLEAVIKQKLGEVNEEEAGRFASLVKTYETMKPKEAANIMSILDLSIMEKIARSMSTKKLAPIMAKMDMKAARALTVRLAQPPVEMTAEKIVMPPVVQNNSKLPELPLE